MNRLVLSDCFLDGPGDQLFNFLSGCPGPFTGGHGDAHRYLRVLALRHREIPVNAPPDDAEQRSPGNLAMLDEIACRVVCVLDEV